MLTYLGKVNNVDMFMRINNAELFMTIEQCRCVQDNQGMLKCLNNVKA